MQNKDITVLNHKHQANRQTCT